MYEAGDGSSFPVATLTCFSTDGHMQWEKMQTYEEMGIIFDSIIQLPDGYLAAGINAAGVLLVRYDRKGAVVFEWEEPISEEVGHPEKLSLKMVGKEAYLVVTCSLHRESEPLIYRTVIKNLHYESPL